MVHHVITNTPKDCTSSCTKSTGTSYNQVHIFIFGLTANHITSGFADYQDHLITNLFEMKDNRKSNYKKIRCSVLMVDYSERDTGSRVLGLQSQ